MVKPKARVDKSKCLACGGCISVCPQDALSWCGSRASVDKNKCISCSICINTCPVGAINQEAHKHEV